MIKGIIASKDEDKVPMIFLGISEKNIEKLRDDKPMVVRGSDMNLAYDILIMYGRTEQVIVEQISGLVKEDTVIKDMRTPDQRMRDEAARLKLGSTGDFPEGTARALNEDDEGGLMTAVAYDPETGAVMLNFGKKVSWIGLSPEQAIEFGESMIKFGKEALAQKPKS